MISMAAWLLLWRPADPIPPQRQSDVIIKYWEKWSGLEGLAIQEVVDDFNNTVGRQKHIYVDLLSMSNIDQKTLVATAAGVGPDVAGLWDANIVQLGALHAIEPLDDLAAKYGIDEHYYKPVYWRGCHFDGHLYCLISTPAAMALFYNTKIFHDNAAKLRAAGLDPDRPPQTLQELDRYADVLNTFRIGADGKKHLDRAGFLPMCPGWYIYETPCWFGDDMWDVNKKKFTLTDPQCIDAFKWIQSYSLKLGSDAVTEFENSRGSYSSTQNEFISGSVAMEQQGPYLATHIHYWRPEMDGQWAVAPFPSADGKPRVTYTQFDSLVVPTGCKHREEAFELIAFINRQDVMEKLCMLHCENSPLQKVSENFLDHHPNPFIRVFEDLAWSPNAYLTVRCPLATELAAELQADAQGVATLTLDPQTALQDSQTRLQTRYDFFESR